MGRRVPPEDIPAYGQQIELTLILDPQNDRFSKHGINFFQSDYTVSLNTYHMGYRLEGSQIEHKDAAAIVFDDIPPGRVQITSDGLPIILLADRQTAGSYVKIATVISVDIIKSDQSRP